MTAADSLAVARPNDSCRFWQVVSNARLPTWTLFPICYDAPLVFGARSMPAHAAGPVNLADGWVREARRAPMTGRALAQLTTYQAVGLITTRRVAPEPDLLRSRQPVPRHVADKDTLEILAGGIAREGCERDRTGRARATAQDGL